MMPVGVTWTSRLACTREIDSIGSNAWVVEAGANVLRSGLLGPSNDPRLAT
jgi:hypothetical protein